MIRLLLKMNLNRMNTVAVFKFYFTHKSSTTLLMRNAKKLNPAINKLYYFFILFFFFFKLMLSKLFKLSFSNEILKTILI